MASVSDTYLSEMALACADVRRRAHEGQFALIRTDIAPAPHRRHENAHAIAARLVVSDLVGELHAVAEALVDRYALRNDRDSMGQRHRHRRLVRGMYQLHGMGETSEFADAVSGPARAWRVRCESLLEEIYGAPSEDTSELPEQDFFAPLT